MDYIWLKALHVTAVLIFVGGLFMQALGVETARRQASGPAGPVTLVARWDRRVTVPAMVSAWLTGALVASAGGWFSSPWLWAKLLLVAGLSGLHGVQSGRLRRLSQRGPDVPATGPFRIAAGIAVSVAAIAVLAVAKPG